MFRRRRRLRAARHARAEATPLRLKKPVSLAAAVSTLVFILVVTGRFAVTALVFPAAAADLTNANSTLNARREASALITNAPKAEG